jgi:hypothetical protein
MANYIIEDIINTHNEVVDNNQKIIGKCYTIIKRYTNKQHVSIFKGKLKQIKYNVFPDQPEQMTNYYIFDDYTYYYRNGKELELPAPYHILPLGEPMSCYVPEIPGSHRISAKFYEMKKLDDKIKQEIILSVVKNEFYKKTKLPEDIFEYMIKEFLI